jgi:hypothetical protein
MAFHDHAIAWMDVDADDEAEESGGGAARSPYTHQTPELSAAAKRDTSRTVKAWLATITRYFHLYLNVPNEANDKLSKQTSDVALQIMQIELLLAGVQRAKDSSDQTAELADLYAHPPKTTANIVFQEGLPDDDDDGTGSTTDKLLEGWKALAKQECTKRYDMPFRAAAFAIDGALAVLREEFGLLDQCLAICDSRAKKVGPPSTPPIVKDGPACIERLRERARRLGLGKHAGFDVQLDDKDL